VLVPLEIKNHPMMKRLRESDRKKGEQNKKLRVQLQKLEKVSQMQELELDAVQATNAKELVAEMKKPLFELVTAELLRANTAVLKVFGDSPQGVDDSQKNVLVKVGESMGSANAGPSCPP
jgi:hypothetical protein